MNDEIKRIQNLLDKYMDGVTSNEEEATLRKYFEEHANDIPEEWESYRALFSYIIGMSYPIDIDCRSCGNAAGGQWYQGKES